MLASAIFLLGEVRGMRAVVVADAVSYVLAGGLLWVATRGMRTDPEHGDGVQRKGYRAVPSDRGNVALAAMNVIATPLITAPLLAMPILVIDQLHFAVSLPALLGALKTMAIAAPTFFVARLLGRRPSLTALVVAAVMWAAGCVAYTVASLDVLAVALLPLGIVALGLWGGCLTHRRLSLTPTGIGTSRFVGSIQGRTSTRLGRISCDRARLGQPASRWRVRLRVIVRFMRTTGTVTISLAA